MATIFLAEIPVLALVRWLYFSIFPKALANVFFAPKNCWQIQLFTSATSFTSPTSSTLTSNTTTCIYISYFSPISCTSSTSSTSTFASHIYLQHLYQLHLHQLHLHHLHHLHNLYHLQRSCYMGIVIQYRSCDTEVVIQELLHRS